MTMVKVTVSVCILIETPKEAVSRILEHSLKQSVASEF